MLPNEYPTERVKRILIIEDDELIVGIYKRKFEAAGFTVDVEMDGSQGYYRIYKMMPDAILLDLLLPGMDGPAIIRKFRAQKKYAHLPIIVFTNAYLTEVGRDAVSAGATRVFNKATVTPQEIVAAVEAALGQQVEMPGVPQPTPVEARPESSNLLPLAMESSFHAEPRLKSKAPPAQTENPAATDEQTASSSVSEEAAAEATLLPANQNISESALQSAVLENFIQKSGARIDALRQALRALQADGRRTPKVDAFVEMARIAHAMSSNAAIVGLHYLAHIAAALEALAWELFDDPSQFAVPTRQTVAKAIDMIARLVECGTSGQLKEFSRFHALVVDDDAIARKIITKTLDRAKLSYVATGRPELAMEMLAENEFDLVILDVKMEKMSGFEFCTAMRQMPQHSHSRVIFVSGLSDFQSKVLSTQVGGNEFIVKPFAPMELGLKVLLHVVSSQLDQQSDLVQEPAETPKAND